MMINFDRLAEVRLKPCKGTAARMQSYFPSATTKQSTFAPVCAGVRNDENIRAVALWPMVRSDLTYQIHNALRKKTIVAHATITIALRRKQNSPCGAILIACGTRQPRLKAQQVQALCRRSATPRMTISNVLLFWSALYFY